MRITYRHKNIKQYWSDRWENIPADEPMENPDAYPLKYAEMTISSRDGRILEAGCGAGRILRYYKNRGYDIHGIDYITEAVRKLKEKDPELNVEAGDITDLKFGDGSFRYVLAFGLYHNLEKDLDLAVRETFRVLEAGGKVCASFRADNLQTRLMDMLAGYGSKRSEPRSAPKQFHKLNLTSKEFRALFEKNGFVIEKLFRVENMSFFFKFKSFRAREQKHFNENSARKDGYVLSPTGRAIQRTLMTLFPEQFCNLFVMIAKKPGEGHA